MGKIKSILIRLLYIFGSLPIIYLVLELGVRITVPQRVDHIPFDDIYTERYSGTLRQNVKSLVPGMRRTYNGMEVLINNAGQRDYEYPKHKRENIIRIAVIGSSVAFGFGNKLENTFSKILEKKLRQTESDIDYEVMLFGRPGFRAKEVYALVMDKVFDYQPDLIVYSFVQNNYENKSALDVLDIIASGVLPSDKSKKRIVKPSSLSKLRNNFSRIKKKEPIRTIRRHSHLYLFSVNSIVRLWRQLSDKEKEKAQNLEPLYPETADFRKKIKNTESWIRLMDKECVDRNIEFYLLMHPYEMQLSAESANKWRSKGIEIPTDVTDLKTHKIMKRFAAREKFKYIDVVYRLRAFQNARGDLFLENDYGHYTAQGNEVIANKLFEIILANKRNNN